MSLLQTRDKAEITLRKSRWHNRHCN